MACKSMTQAAKLGVSLIPHKMAVGMTLSFRLKSVLSQQMAIYLLLLWSIITPIGQLLGLIMKLHLDDNMFIELLNAFALGTFFYILFFEIVPQEFNCSEGGGCEGAVADKLAGGCGSKPTKTDNSNACASKHSHQMVPDINKPCHSTVPKSNTKTNPQKIDHNACISDVDKYDNYCTAETVYTAKADGCCETTAINCCDEIDCNEIADSDSPVLCVDDECQPIKDDNCCGGSDSNRSSKSSKQSKRYQNDIIPIKKMLLLILGIFITYIMSLVPHEHPNHGPGDGHSHGMSDSSAEVLSEKNEIQCTNAEGFRAKLELYNDCLNDEKAETQDTCSDDLWTWWIK